MDVYEGLARYYDSENAALTADLPLYSTLAARFGGPVLDIGCGTGRIAFHLADEGYDVTGIDPSAAMLDRARAVPQAADQPGSLAWLEADITTLALDARFGFALFAFSGFMHLLTQDAQIAAVERAAAHLKPGGGLVIDVANPIEMFLADEVASLVWERTFTDAETGHTVMQHSLAAVDRVTQIMDLTWVYDRIEDDGRVIRSLVPQEVRYVMPTEMALLMQRAGLADVELYGDYEFGDITEESPRLIAVATKS